MSDWRRGCYRLRTKYGPALSLSTSGDPKRQESAKNSMKDGEIRPKGQATLTT